MKVSEVVRAAREVADWTRMVWRDTARQRAEIKDEALFIGMNIVGGVMVAGLVGFTLGRRMIPVVCTLVKGLRSLKRKAEEGLKRVSRTAMDRFWAAWRFREELIAEYA